MAKGIKRPLPLVVEALKVVIKKLGECIALPFNYKRMDYNTIAGKYKPVMIKILLIGEAPPPNQANYFYKVPDKYPTKKSTIENDSSLPATIFNHYFSRRPLNEKEYEKFLCLLKEKGVFLIDIIHKPLEIRRKDMKILTQHPVFHFFRTTKYH